VSERVVEVDFVWDQAEFARVTQDLFQRHLASGRGLYFAIFFGTLVFIFFGQFAYRAWLEEGPSMVLIGGAPWILILSLWAWYFWRGAGWLAARRAAKLEPRTDRLQKHQIDDIGIHMDTGAGSSSLPWTGAVRILETSDHFLWFWNAQHAHFTPKRVMTAGQVAVVRQLISLHAPAVAERDAKVS